MHNSANAIHQQRVLFHCLSLCLSLPLFHKRNNSFVGLIHLLARRSVLFALFGSIVNRVRLFTAYDAGKLAVKLAGTFALPYTRHDKLTKILQIFEQLSRTVSQFAHLGAYVSNVAWQKYGSKSYQVELINNKQ